MTDYKRDLIWFVNSNEINCDVSPKRNRSKIWITYERNILATNLNLSLGDMSSFCSSLILY